MPRDAEADRRRVRESSALTGRAERDAVGARIVAGYLAQPQTDDELTWAREGAERAIAAEPWLIDVRAGVRSGQPCFAGTRITVGDVLEYLAAGMTNDEIVADFPELSEAHIRAALEFAAARERHLT